MTEPRFKARSVAVTLARGAAPVRVHALFARARVTVVRSVPEIRMREVRLPSENQDGAIATLRASPLVASTQRNPLVSVSDVVPDDQLWSYQWGLRAIGLPQAWGVARSGAAVTVAVVDTGVDAAQPDLAGAVLPGIDLVTGGSAADDEGHGTSVAGIIAARTGNHLGMAGICSTCSILPVKVLDAHGSGDDAAVAAGIVDAVDAGARVLNLSLGGPVGIPPLADAVAYAQEKGALVVAAAGNDGVTSQEFPAAYPGVLSVAATDEQNARYSWSNYGAWVSVAAPGCDVAPVLAGGYGSFCGTSAATPVVAGISALALTVAPASTEAQVAEAFEGTATPLAGVVQHGLVQAPAALAKLGVTVPAALTTSSFSGSVVRGRVRSYTRTVAAGATAVEAVFTRFRTLTLTIRDSRGAVIARRTGSSPLRVARVLAAGSYRFQLSGARTPTAFTLSVVAP